MRGSSEYKTMHALFAFPQKKNNTVLFTFVFLLVCFNVVKIELAGVTIVHVVCDEGKELYSATTKHIEKKTKKKEPKRKRKKRSKCGANKITLPTSAGALQLGLSRYFGQNTCFP